MAPNPETIVADLANTTDLLSLGLQSTPWPTRFRMPEVTKDAGKTNPIEFIRVYETAVAAAGEATFMAKSLPLALLGVAQSCTSCTRHVLCYSWEQL